VFRTRKTPLTNANFKCGDLELDIVSEYKYLGLMLNEHLNWDLTVKTLAASANRALGVLIAKSKQFGGFPFDVFTSAYNAMVRPILEYGCEIWGFTQRLTLCSIEHADFSLVLEDIHLMQQ
jgi:hypothetical protein